MKLDFKGDSTTTSCTSLYTPALHYKGNWSFCKFENKCFHFWFNWL